MVPAWHLARAWRLHGAWQWQRLARAWPYYDALAATHACLIGHLGLWTSVNLETKQVSDLLPVLSGNVD